jgi:succinyl-CoA synthetase alpha subunit
MIHSGEPFIPTDVGVVIQGITGRIGRQHAQLMRQYGTCIVAGVPTSANVEGSGNLTQSESVVDGVQLYPSCTAAVQGSGARASVIMVPPMGTLNAIREALDAGIHWIVTIAEGMPIHDAVRALELVRAAGACWIGPSTPGLAIPGRLKLGFLPDVSLAPGSLGVMTKSGTLSYEVCSRLVQRGLGQSLWVGVGGDPVKGTRFADLLPWFLADAGTRAIVLVGEIGGSEEEEFAQKMRELSCQKPVFALIAGKSAPEGITMGHAGALVSGGTGGLDSKVHALTAAGAKVYESIEDLVAGVVRCMAQNK